MERRRREGGIKKRNGRKEGKSERQEGWMDECHGVLIGLDPSNDRGYFEYKQHESEIIKSITSESICTEKLLQL